jgi:hypothetical protein
MDGTATWTSIGDERGQDPLAMRAPIESLYQNLLTGFSTVTTRLRYYSFHSWWLSEYAKDGPTDSRQDYNHRARRAEALFALASMYNTESLIGNSGESGISGRNFASSALASPSTVIDFRKDTDLATDPDDRYLARAGGDFSQVYAPQMREIGLLRKHTQQRFMVATDEGRQLATHFSTSIGEAGPVFLQAAKDGYISRDKLAKLTTMRPSAIRPDSGEAQMLRDILMGRIQPTQADITRRNTLQLILHEGTRVSNSKLDQERLRWQWMAVAPDEESHLSSAHRSWRHFQAADIARIVCERLLQAALDHLAEAPGGLPLSDICAILADPAGDQENLGDYLRRINLERTDCDFQDLQAQALDGPPTLDVVLAPLARLWLTFGDEVDALGADYLDEPGRQTIVHVLRQIEVTKNLPASLAIALFCKCFVVLRHLSVASRKLHASRSYTYLLEFEDGRIQFRDPHGVASSGPRLTTALRFLHDAGLLKNDTVTDYGQSELETP